MKLKIKKDKETVLRKAKDMKLNTKKDGKIKHINAGLRSRNAVSDALSIGGKAVMDNVEGSEEIEEALELGKTGLRTARNTADVTCKTVRGTKDVSQKAGSILRTKEKGKKLATQKAKQKIRKKAKNKVKTLSKKTSKKVAKETSKETTKITAKVAAKAGTTAAGSTAGPYGLAIGYAVGEAVGEGIEQFDYRNTQRIRKLKFMFDKLKPQEEQSDNIFKLAKDLIRSALFHFGRKVIKLILLLILPILIMIISIGAVVMGIVAILYNSPLSFFLPPLSTGETIHSVTTQYVSEFNRHVDELAEAHVDADQGRVIYVDFEGSTETLSNYYDIMCVYMVKYGYETTATEMSETNKTNLKAVVDDMCSFTTGITEETEGKGKNKKTVKYLDVKVSLKTYSDMVTTYSFNGEQEEMLNYLMRECRAKSSSGGSTGGNRKSSLTEAEIKGITDKISDSTQKKVCTFALSKVGYPYSQAKRASGDYFDCSSLAYYSWQDAGVDIMYDGSNCAAAEAHYCDEYGMSVNESELQPGDLIFYSYKSNGRYKNITHVGIYVGDSMMVEAVDDNTGVVLQDYHNKNLVMIGRPNKKKEKKNNK
ncbi:MAG: C40 family peptidase [Lachnospiraceae bacterium]|nr:C40 family peptidase [Lachnospiraceae bacterium]